MRPPRAFAAPALVAVSAARLWRRQVGGRRGEYIKPSTTAKTVRNAKGQMVLTDVPDTIRTSHNAWCQHRGCYDHPMHERVIRRIMNLVDLPPDFAEHMQLLKYGPGEYYRLHHDWIPEQQQASSRRQLGGSSVVSRRQPGGISAAALWYLGGSSVVSRRQLGGSSATSRQCLR